MGNGRDLLLDVLARLVPYIGCPHTLDAIAARNETAPMTGPQEPDRSSSLAATA